MALLDHAGMPETFQDQTLVGQCNETRTGLYLSRRELETRPQVTAPASTLQNWAEYTAAFFTWLWPVARDLFVREATEPRSVLQSDQAAL